MSHSCAGRNLSATHSATHTWEIPACGAFQKCTRSNLYRRNLSAEARRSTPKSHILSETKRLDDTRRKDSAGTNNAQIGSRIFWKVPCAGMTRKSESLAHLCSFFLERWRKPLVTQHDGNSSTGKK